MMNEAPMNEEFARIRKTIVDATRDFQGIGLLAMIVVALDDLVVATDARLARIERDQAAQDRAINALAEYHN